MSKLNVLKISLALVCVSFSPASHGIVSEPITSMILATRGAYMASAADKPVLAEWKFPVQNSVITSCYGHRRLLGKFYDFHSGIDFGAPKNTPVIAVAPGKVIWTGSMGCAGEALVIRHYLKNKTTVFSIYKHLSKYKVAVGDSVRGGQPVALSGATGERLAYNQTGEKHGCITGPHLHVEFKLLRPELTQGAVERMLKKTNGHMADTVIPINPLHFLPKLKTRCS
jgi:murein DD-endopeptidase MepM/ murein hydrolase activator NlpD